MGDYYPATITIQSWPDWAVVGAENGDTAVDTIALRKHGHNALADAFESYTGEGSWYDSSYRDGELMLMDDQASGGVYAFGEIREALEHAEFAYVAEDDGYCEFPGEQVEWRPGWDSERGVTFHSGAGVLMSVHDFETIIGQSADLEDAAKRGAQFFNPDAEESK